MNAVKSVIMALILCLFLVPASQAGAAAMDFTLPGTDDKNHTLADYKDSKAVVVIFISTRCPVSNGFNQRMVELAKMYQSKGIVFLGINSNKMENMPEIKKHVDENGFPFIVLKDNKNVVADLYKAKVTPEVFVHNNVRELLYHGRIDDSSIESERKTTDLKMALDELLGGGDIAIADTKAFGCSIKRE